eukprot:3940638-Rhodomonas_salina.2
MPTFQHSKTHHAASIGTGSPSTNFTAPGLLYTVASYLRQPESYRGKTHTSKTTNQNSQVKKENQGQNKTEHTAGQTTLCELRRSCGSMWTVTAPGQPGGQHLMRLQFCVEHLGTLASRISTPTSDKKRLCDPRVFVPQVDVFNLISQRTGVRVGENEGLSHFLIAAYAM